MAKVTCPQENFDGELLGTAMALVRHQDWNYQGEWRAVIVSQLHPSNSLPHQQSFLCTLPLPSYHFRDQWKD
jgi:hypothetical protein